MSAIHEFFAMGGYAFYVWLSYAMVGSVLTINFLKALHQRKSIKKYIIKWKQKQAYESNT